MQLTMLVNIGSGDYTVTTNLYTIVMWERKYKRKISQIQDGGLGIEDLAYMAHEASKQQNAVTVPLMLDDFIKQLVNLEVIEQPDANPTEVAPTDIP